MSADHALSMTPCFEHRSCRECECGRHHYVEKAALFWNPRTQDFDAIFTHHEDCMPCRNRWCTCLPYEED